MAFEGSKNELEQPFDHRVFVPLSLTVWNYNSTRDCKIPNCTLNEFQTEDAESEEQLCQTDLSVDPGKNSTENLFEWTDELQLYFSNHYCGPYDGYESRASSKGTSYLSYHCVPADEKEWGPCLQYW